jgi:hypothetical protein
MSHLKELYQLIHAPKPNADQIIQLMEQHQISPNVVLPVNLSKEETQLAPLIYLCCRRSQLTKLFTYLINSQVILNAPILSNDGPIELLYYSQTKYLPELIKQGATLDAQYVVPHSVKLLIGGNLPKLLVLYRLGAITKHQLKSVLQSPQLVFQILDQLYVKVFNLCQSGQDYLVESVISSYLLVFKFIFKNGLSVNQMIDDQTFFQRAINTYFYQLIKTLMKFEPDYDRVRLYHYSNFELNNRIVMSSIYNEDNWQQISTLLNHKIISNDQVVRKQIRLH